MPNNETINPKLIELSRSDPEILLQLKGQRIKHKVFGDGTIISIEPGDNLDKDSYALILFDHEVQSKRYGLTNQIKIALSYFNGEAIAEVSVPPSLAHKLREFEQRKIEKELKAKRQRELEEEARKEFDERKEKYQVAFYKDNSPSSPLNGILIKLDDNKNLSSDDEKWLRSNQLFPVLAIYCERKNRLAEAGSNWRKANNPDKALEITANISHPNHYILTMRGGAFRDKGELGNAEKCANEAINLALDNYYPFNLLGAIYYQRGSPEDGETYFEKARSLGSEPKEEDENIHSAIKKAGKVEQKKVANYLIEKDPKRYDWAKDYLK